MLRLEYRKASELVENPANWRKHPRSQTLALEGVLREVGWAGALLYNEATGRLIDGHLRREVAKDAEVPVLIGSWTEEQERLILATLDPIAAMAQADKDALIDLLGSIRTEDKAIQALLEAVANDEHVPMPYPQGKTEPDDVPPDPTEVYVQRGDIWLLGEHRLMCGDSTDAEDVTRLLDGAKPMLTVTDPPYGVDYEGGTSNLRKRDRLTGDDDTGLYAPTFRLSPSDVIYSWFADRNAEAVYTAARLSGFAPRAMIVWNKTNAHYGAAAADYKQRHEPCLYSVRVGSPSRFNGATSEPTVWDIPQASVNEFHPTQKPVECMERPIRNHEFREVYDPFVGSGTTIIAAERLGRRCYAMEIEPRYVQVSLERWQNYTGKKAVKA